MRTHQHLPLNDFLSHILLAKNLSSEQLIQLFGQEKAYELINELKKTKKRTPLKDVKNKKEMPQKKAPRQKKTLQKNQDIGKETANRILDNANNWIGAPALGSSTAIVLHGQLHEFTGAISDVKARISKKIAQKNSPQRSEKEAIVRKPSPKLHR